MNNSKIESKDLGIVGSITITKKLKEIIDKLHREIGNKEWSGMLFYKVVKDNVRKNEFEVLADFLYPLDIGSHTYTETNAGEENLKAYDIYEEAINRNVGLIHSHNNFNTFFSGTDNDELLANAGNFNYYVSLIVNFEGNYCCKVAIPSVTEVVTKSKIKNRKGEYSYVNTKEEKEIILVGDLNVYIEVLDTTDWLTERITELKAKNAAKVKEFNKAPTWSQAYLEEDYQASIVRSFANSPAKFYNPNVYNPNAQVQTKAKLDNQGIDEFFATLILYGEETKDITKALDSIIVPLKDEEQAFFDEYLDSNIDTIYHNTFGYNISRRTASILLSRFEQYAEKYKETEPYKSIHLTLKTYVEC